MIIILLHGFCEDHSIWEDLLPYLNVGDRVICIDLPGFGIHSGDAANAVSTELMAIFVKKEIDKLKLGNGKKVMMIGHSLGGYVTLAFAGKFPGMLAAIGLFHSTATPDSEERKASRLKAIEFVKANGAEAYHRVLIPNLFQKDTEPAIIEKTISKARNAKEDGIIAALTAMANRPDSLDVLESLEIPVLFIAGEKDTVIPKKIILDQALLCKKAIVEVLSKSAHMGMIEEPKPSAAIISGFYKSVVSAQ